MVRSRTPAALGFRAHSGWAAAVAVAGTPRAPEILERRRIEIRSLVVEATVGERRNGRAVRVEQDDTTPRCEDTRRAVEEPRRARQMVEHVDEHEVRNRSVVVGKVLGVDHLRRPWRRLDIRRDRRRIVLLETADAAPELNCRTGYRRELRDDEPVPRTVQPPHEWTCAPVFLLRAQVVDERLWHVRAHLGKRSSSSSISR